MQVLSTANQLPEPETRNSGKSDEQGSQKDSAMAPELSEQPTQSQQWNKKLAGPSTMTLTCTEPAISGRTAHADLF